MLKLLHAIKFCRRSQTNDQTHLFRFFIELYGQWQVVVREEVNAAMQAERSVSEDRWAAASRSLRLERARERNETQRSRAAICIQSRLRGWRARRFYYRLQVWFKHTIVHCAENATY